MGKTKEHLDDYFFKNWGNSIFAWLMKVYDLLVASRLIDNHVKKIKNSNPFARKTLPISVHAVDPCFMLKGFAIECYLKAIYLIQGNKFIVKDKYEPIPNANQHNLREISTAINLNIFSKDDLRFLDTLSHYATGPGRYPVSKHSKGGRKFYIPDNYFEVFNEIIKNISNEVLRYPKLNKKNKSDIDDIIKLVS